MASPATIRFFCDPTERCPELCAPAYGKALVASGLGVRAVAMRGGHLQLATSSSGLETQWNPEMDEGWAELAGLFAGLVADAFVNVVAAPPDAQVSRIPVFEAFATVRHPNVAITTMPSVHLPVQHVVAFLKPLAMYDMVICPTIELAHAVMTACTGVEAMALEPDGNHTSLAAYMRSLAAPGFVPRFNPVLH